MNITAIKIAPATTHRPLLHERRNYAHTIAASTSLSQSTSDELRASERALLADPRLTPPGVWSHQRTALRNVQAELTRRTA